MQPQPKRRPDGSIAIEYYAARARELRSKKAHKLMRTKKPDLPRPWFRLRPALFSSS